MAALEDALRTALLWIAPILAAGLLLLAGWRQFDHRRDRTETARLTALQPRDPQLFSAGMVADLPEPARRFFTFAIREGTPLHRVAAIEMRGRFGLGTKAAPNYVDMTARQILASPQGFVWRMAGGTGAMRMSGSDSQGWTRFWLLGLLPVARSGGTDDHARSAFGRHVSEAVFWTPAAVLPGPGITWRGIDATTARLTVRHDGFEQSVNLKVGPDGRPVEVRLERWTNANPDREYRRQPFGGYLSDFREFEGFRLPTHVEAGNFFGTDAYFPFFIADVTSLGFPRNGPAE